MPPWGDGQPAAGQLRQEAPPLFRVAEAVDEEAGDGLLNEPGKGQPQVSPGGDERLAGRHKGRPAPAAAAVALRNAGPEETRLAHAPPQVAGKGLPVVQVPAAGDMRGGEPREAVAHEACFCMQIAGHHRTSSSMKRINWFRFRHGRTS